jgi:TPR repeat protein
LALINVAQCYLKGEGVEKDAVHGVSLLRQVINQEDATKARAEKALTSCYMEGNGVEADTVQAALWC